MPSSSFGAMSPALSDPPAPPSRTSAERAARRHEDDARFIRAFQELTGHLVRSASIDALPREFLAQTIASPEELANQYGDWLEPRTRNALQRYEPGWKPKPRWTYGRLLEVRGFGLFSLIDLLQVMRKLDAQAPAP